MASPLRRLGVYLELVYTFPTTVLLGAGLGYLADRAWGLSPYGTLVGFLVGLLGAFVYLIRMLALIRGRERNGDGEDKMKSEK